MSAREQPSEDVSIGERTLHAGAPETATPGDEGSILPLVAGLVALALALALGVTAIGSLEMSRSRLQGLADAAADAGAESFTLDSLTAGHPKLGSAEVRASASDWLAAAPDTSRFDSLRLVSATTSDGLTATVELSAVWHPPILSALLPDGVSLDVSAHARSVLR